jgi:ribosomal protein S18 acetylase RimI-like enzyme
LLDKWCHGEVARLAEEIEIDIEDIRKSNLKDIPGSCRGCVYWEFPNDFEKGKADPQKKAELKSKKRKWFEKALEEFGSCGKIVYHEGKPIAYAQYSSPERLPHVNSYESKPVGKVEEGVVFLSCLYVADEAMRDKGIGEQLLQNIIEDLRRKGFKAIETFACRDSTNNPSGPMAFYIKNGFHIKDKTNADFPLMRLFL